MWITAKTLLKCKHLLIQMHLVLLTIHNRTWGGENCNFSTKTNMFDRLLMLLQATVHIYLMNIILKALKLSIKISTLYKLWVTRWKSKLFLLSQVDWTTPQIIFDWLSVSCICSNSSKLISLLSCQDHTAYIQSPSQYVIQHFQIN